jgi:hypothetical protein
MCGAAVMKMMLDWCMWNSTIHPEGPPDVYDQHQLYNDYARGDHFNIGEMQTGLNNEIPGAPDWEYGYWFGPTYNISRDRVLKSICIFIDYDVSFPYEQGWTENEWPKPGHPHHVPVAIPAYGDYSNWMAVRGIHTNRTAWQYPDFPEITIYGFWLNDPLPGGIGGNTYVTVQRFVDTYFFQLDVPGDPYDGKYVALIEPPEGLDIDNINIDSSVTYAETSARFTEKELNLIKHSQVIGSTGLIQDMAKNLLIEAASEQTWKVVRYDSEFAKLFSGATPGEIEFKDDEYTVNFINGKVTFKVTLNQFANLLEFKIVGL